MISRNSMRSSSRRGGTTKHYWNLPCHTLHSPATSHTPYDRQYPRATAVLRAWAIPDKHHSRKNPRATGLLLAQVTHNNHQLKTHRDSIPPLLLKVRSAVHSMYISSQDVVFLTIETGRSSTASIPSLSPPATTSVHTISGFPEARGHSCAILHGRRRGATYGRTACSAPVPFA